MAGPFPCPNPPSPCETNANPVTGFSSEAEDSTTFIGLAWNGNPPPLNKPFNLVPCEAIVDSQVSQADADRLAQNAAVACSSPCTQPFQNTAQTATGQCSDGSSYSLTIPAGQYTAENQVLADRLAFTAATQALRGHSICLGSLAPVSVCRGEFYFGQVSVVTTDGPASMQMSGELPDGLSITFESDRAVIQGTPTSFGTSMFVITATSAIGVVTSKTYQVTVAGIITGSPLPNVTQGDAYTAQLQAVTPDGITTWSIQSGALPDGLALNALTGEISGTPTTAGTSDFTVAVSTDGLTCSKDFSIQVASSGPTPSCLVSTGTDISIPGFPDNAIINTGSAAFRRFAVIDGNNLGNVYIVNSQTNAVIHTNPCGPNGGDREGESAAFATSVGMFYIPKGGGIIVLDSNGNTVTTIANPANETFTGCVVYSPDQDRLYATAFNSLTGTIHIVEINPNTNTVTNDADTLDATGPRLLYYPNNLAVEYPSNRIDNYTLPTIVKNKTLAIAANWEMAYAASSGQIFVGVLDFVTNPVVAINTTTFTVAHTYTPASNFSDKNFVKYNPVTGAVIVFGNSMQVTVLDPLHNNIVCEFVVNGDNAGGGIGIDFSSGQTYLLDNNFATNPLFIYT